MKDVEKPPSAIALTDELRIKEFVRLLADPEIEKQIKKFNEEYLHWDTIRHYRHPEGISNETIWGVVKLSRMLQYKRVRIGSTDFKYVMSGTILRALQKFDQQGGGMLESREERLAPGTSFQRYLINSLMEEAIASSQLEGAATSREAAKQLLRTGKKPKDNSQRMIVNNYKTMLFLKEAKTRPLTVEFMLEIQKKITEGTIEEGYVGKFRDSDDVNVYEKSTGELFWRPPNHIIAAKMIETLCKFINEDTTDFVHPIIKAIVLHFMIGYIHPFHDGNGRTGRALFYWYLLKSGYWLFEYMPISRIIKRAPSQYSKAYRFTETDENDITYFINFSISKINLALEEFKEYVKIKAEETEKIREIVSDDGRLNFRQADMILRFVKNPGKEFSMDEMKKIYNVVYQTTRTDLELLAKLDYCQKIKSGKKFLYVFNRK